MRAHKVSAKTVVLAAIIMNFALQPGHAAPPAGVVGAPAPAPDLSSSSSSGGDSKSHLKPSDAPPNGAFSGNALKKSGKTSSSSSYSGAGSGYASSSSSSGSRTH